MIDADLQAVRSDDALAAIWSASGTVPAGQAAVRYRFLPTSSTPRLVIPEQPRVASRTLLRSLRDGSTTRARLKTGLLAASLHTPTPRDSRVQLPPPAIVDFLQQMLGRDDLVVGIHLGPPRANRKPVLALCSDAGELVGFAKVAVNDLTETLVRNEAQALRRLPMEAKIHTPRLIAEGTWRERPVTLQAPVPDVGRRIHDPDAVAAAQVAVATSGGVDNGAQSYLQRLDARLARVEQEDPDNQSNAQSLRVSVAQLTQDPVTESIRCGAWHGDWRRTNMSVGHHGVGLWDWERFDDGVPLGFDALHLGLTTSAADGQNLTVLVNVLFADARRTLTPFEILDPAHVTFVTTAYLVEFATRSLEDQQSRSGTRLGDVRRWLLPELESRRTRTT